MPADLVKRIDLDLIYPPMVEKALNVLAACRKRGADYYATRGFDSYDVQKELYRRYLVGIGGKAAPPGFSGHNYGIAWDLCRDADLKKPGLQMDWNEADYAILGEETERAGLVWGGTFGDRPHIQWPGYVNAKQIAPLLHVWNATPTTESRLKAVWKFIDERKSA